MENLVLTIDYGTQSVRVGLVNNKGEIVALKKEGYEIPYISKHPGWAEQDPNEYHLTFVKAARALLEENKELVKQIKCVCLTCFRDTAVMCDDNMNPTRLAFVWLDQRLADAKKPLPLSAQAIFKLVGKWETIKLNRKRTPAVWVEENEPEVWKKTTRYMNVSTYLTYKIIGEYKDSAACYTGHFPTDFKHRRFYKSDKHLQGQIFNIKLKMLPELVQPGDLIGKVNKECSKETLIPEGLEMYACGSDKACETIGLGVMKNNMVAISCGTASTVSVTNKKFVPPAPFLPAYPAAVKGYFNTETQVYRGYWMLKWFATEFASRENDQAKKDKVSIERLLSARLKDVPPGCDGLVLQPYWGPGLSRPISRGSVIGFSDTHKAIHLYRAIIEGIDYDLREGLEIAEKNQHKKTDCIRISGGGSQCDDICQIAADIFNKPVSRVQTFETSTLGAAICGFLAIKEFENIDDAIEAMVHPQEPFMPNKENAKMYDFLYKKVYKKMYPALKKMYKNIKIQKDGYHD